MRHLHTAAAVLGAAVLLALSGCTPSGFTEHRFEDVRVAVPDGWAESPADALDDTWQFGLDDSAEGETRARLRVAPMYGSSPHPVNAESTLFADAEMGQRYGKDFHADVREETEIEGARSAFKTEFTYSSTTGTAMTGRWWFMSNPDTGQVSGVELVGESDALDPDLIRDVERTLELDPQDEG